MAVIKVERTISAPFDSVWAVASDFGKSPGPSISVVVEKAGDPRRLGAGTVRLITVGKVTARERLETINPLGHFTYRLLSGAPVKSYLGQVEFRPDGDSTIVRWTAEFIPKYPGTGWIIKRAISGVINKFIDELG